MSKLNERAWAGQIIGWIKESINNGKTIFQDATNDEGLKLDSGVTKFPDILLFTDKVSGVVFNGWELKFPDTRADDPEMLHNALEKAEKLKSNSFVTWNGKQAIIWKIPDDNYKIESLSILKKYSEEVGIRTREDLANRSNYQKFESRLKGRLEEILHDLAQFYESGELKEAINISSNIVVAVKDAAAHIVPQLANIIADFKGENVDFRNKFNKWKILESATLKILESSSRRVERVVPEEVLAKFTYYKLIGKILFYQTLAANLSGRVEELKLANSKGIKDKLDALFSHAKKIDYQAVFEPDFTDVLEFNETIENFLFSLLEILGEFDFKLLPAEVIGNILENLVPKNERQKFGQYFTPERLANLVAFSAVKTRNNFVIDPACGTGTFLTAFYKILNYYGCKNHQQLLNQIWGNDISHFPAVLSVINLYKQKVEDYANFPRVTRQDYFSLSPDQRIKFPDSVDIQKLNEVKLPEFDAIAGNFPFIQQEDIRGFNL